jgi:septum formation protein
MAQSAVPSLPWPVVLASGSPRRKALLAGLVPQFEVLPTHVDEGGVWAEPTAAALELALRKARWAAERRPDALVLGGDTVVWLEGTGFLDKPTDPDDAVRTLMALQGRTHTVATGVALVWPGGERAFVEESRVTFHPFGEDSARDYVATGEPMDKAGAYGLQAGGRALVAHVEGSESTVVGLPLERLALELGLLATGSLPATGP